MAPDPDKARARLAKSNSEKAKQLGMPLGTATGRLRKSILFMLVQRCGLDVCYRCGNKIESESDLSIDHKKDWLYSDDPPGLFFDVENISFSHLSCNCAHSHNNRMYFSDGERMRAQARYQRAWRRRQGKERMKTIRREKYERTGT